MVRIAMRMHGKITVRQITRIRRWGESLERCVVVVCRFDAGSVENDVLDPVLVVELDEFMVGLVPDVNTTLGEIMPMLLDNSVSLLVTETDDGVRKETLDDCGVEATLEEPEVVERLAAEAGEDAGEGVVEGPAVEAMGGALEEVVFGVVEGEVMGAELPGSPLSLEVRRSVSG